MGDELSEQDLARFSDALVAEVKAQMGRSGVGSSRALARLIGESSQYVSSRLDGGNPKTGERIPLHVRDIAAMAAALDVSPSILIARAEELAERRKLEAEFNAIGDREVAKLEREAAELGISLGRYSHEFAFDYDKAEAAVNAEVDQIAARRRAKASEAVSNVDLAAEPSAAEPDRRDDGSGDDNA